MKGGGGIVTGVLPTDAAQQAEMLVTDIKKVRTDL